MAIQETRGNETPHPWQIHRLGFMREAPLAPSKVPRAEGETLCGEIGRLRATNAAQSDRILLLQMEVSLVRAPLHEESLLREGRPEQARALAYGLAAKTGKSEAVLLATEVREVRARNVEQEIKILQLFDLILEHHAEVGRRRAPVVEGEAEEGARSIAGFGSHCERLGCAPSWRGRL